PHVVDLLKNGEVSLVFNTVEEKRGAIADSRAIRTTALAQRVTYFTTIAGAIAAVQGMRTMQPLDVYSLQELHARLAHCAAPRGRSARRAAGRPRAARVFCVGVSASPERPAGPASRSRRGPPRAGLLR